MTRVDLTCLLLCLVQLWSVDAKSRCPLTLFLDEDARFGLCVSHEFVGRGACCASQEVQIAIVSVANEKFFIAALDGWHRTEVDNVRLALGSLLMLSVLGKRGSMTSAF